MSKLNLSIVILAIFLMVLPNAIFGIGQMSKPIIFQDVLRGQTVQETLTLYGSEGQAETFGLVAEGVIKDWTSFYLPDNLGKPISEVVIPAKANINVIAKFKVPATTPNGTYTGQVAVFSAPSESEQTEGASVNVGLRVDREVSIIVTDKEIIKFATTIIPAEYGIAAGSPLKIKVIYENQGNVEIKPNLQLKISQIDTGSVVHNAIYPYPEGEGAVKPLERKILPDLIVWSSSGQPNGKYKAEIKVLLNGAIQQEESFRFDVGVDIMTLLLANIAVLGGGNLIFAWFVIGIILAILAGILAYFVKRPALVKAAVSRIRVLF